MSRDATHYCIKGFRSLVDFRITLTPGLNVIVGPNGSGKTNFIEFLDFLDSLIRFGAANAVSMSGGVSKVFSVENFKKQTPVLSCEINSIAKIEGADRVGELGLFFRFKYQIEIKFNKSESQIYISKEKIFVNKCHSLADITVGEQKVGSIQVTRAGPAAGHEPKFEVSKRIYATTERNPFSYIRKFGRGRDIKDVLDRIELSTLEPDQSMITTRPGFLAMDALRNVISRGKSFNIIPDKARAADHISKAPNIESDGSGLSSVLHLLKRLRDGKEVNYYRYEGLPRESFDMVLHWTNLILPELQDISINHDLHLGSYTVTLSINKEKPLKILIQSASDGTIKWLALICLIVTNRGVGCLEEPENFLHPRMQSFLLEIIRDTIGSSDRQDYFIISTHSETIINGCSPVELVLFRFTESGTVCGRIRDPKKVSEEINKTGFGLGYYYASNAL
ncbi:MAG: ATP-binding protein [Rhizobium sp.]|nr:ATP-binding protein [Rhizobium sp.]